MAREDLHFRLRIPEDLKTRIEASADYNNRSMTAEIVSRLTASLNNDARLTLAQAEAEELRLKVARQEGAIAALRHQSKIVLDYLAKALAGEKITKEELFRDLNIPLPGEDEK